MSIADLALVLASRAWRPERGPFRPFAWRYVKRETLLFLRADRRQHDTRDAAEMLAVIRPPECEDTSASECLLRRAQEALPESVWRIGMAHFVDGRTMRQLAATHGCSFRQIRQRVIVFVETVEMLRGRDRALS